MLSGMQDEIVPKEHMRALWDAVVARGGKGVEAGRGDGERKEEETERAKYMEFEEGGHSESSLFPVNVLWMLIGNVDDTCVQQGYWSAIIEFVESLAGDKERRGSTTPVRSRTAERERPKKF